jgi:zinc D-Ala-D-Ala carboxypeptidase
MESKSYFSISEMCKSPTACRLKISNTPPPEAIKNLQGLIEHVLDPLRAAYGFPVIVSSGYRCAALNKAIGGVPTSQHMLGQAADIHTVADTPEANRELFNLIQRLRLPYDQLINEYNFNWIHVSFSPRNRRQVIAIK